MARDFSFIPGQYLALEVPGGPFRCYSIASSPKQIPLWQMFIDISPQGPGTTYLQGLKKGQIVKTLGPMGEFTCKDDKSKKFIFGATGCGLAPYLSMIESLLMRQPQPKVFLFWGLRHKTEIALENVLSSWEKKNKNFSYEIVLSQPKGKWSGRTGHVNEFLAHEAKKPLNRQTSVYLCGNSGFVQENIQALQKIRFPSRQIHFENYC
jgi:ferredoxin-NADP reductase